MGNKSFTAKAKSAALKFVEQLGDRIFIGAATVYVAKSGDISTVNDLKAVAIAGALAGVIWALSVARNSGN